MENEDSNLLWPAASNVDKYEAQLPELLEPPDDTFATLYQLGFRKLGYVPDQTLVADTPAEPLSSEVHEDGDSCSDDLFGNVFGLDFGDD